MTIKRKINDTAVKILGKKAIRKIPRNLLKEYTMDNTIPVSDKYFSERGIFPRIYTKKLVRKYLRQVIDEENNSTSKYRENKSFREALHKYSIKGLTVVNIGSCFPYYEAAAIYFGAKKIIILEYNPMYSFDKRIKCMTPKSYEKNPIIVDAGFSISSFEHDGLGRYGNPLDPNADLKSMQKMKKIIKKGGILFLAVPIGKDEVVWNANRIYGPKRLPLLLKGWEHIDTIDYDEKLWNQKDNKVIYQPILILKNI